MIKVVDLAGNPINISVIVRYRVTDAPRLYLATKDMCVDMIKLQAEATVKNIACRYPFNADDPHTDSDAQHSLRTSSDEVTNEFIQDLQSHVSAWGVTIINMQIVDLSYAPEIALQMLAVQQAQATMKARKIIVENTVVMVKQVLHELKGQLTEADASIMARNLTVVMAGHNAPSPVFNIDR